jgi:hypothetical protein
VLDTATIMDMAAHADQCDLFPVGGAFQTFDLSVAFPQDAPDDFISSVSASMVRLQVRNSSWLLQITSQAVPLASCQCQPPHQAVVFITVSRLLHACMVLLLPWYFCMLVVARRRFP